MPFYDLICPKCQHKIQDHMCSYTVRNEVPCPTCEAEGVEQKMAVDIAGFKCSVKWLVDTDTASHGRECS